MILSHFEGKLCSLPLERVFLDYAGDEPNLYTQSINWNEKQLEVPNSSLTSGECKKTPKNVIPEIGVERER